ncbi:hypothetical protein WH43_01200 [Rheinheimera sp. KL1]|uniref:hypothetical protein n=1 Tax=Rheinheimera sp. KL1 TaxID=1635005 RepID=UPI0006A9CBA8|nr:hypothetical protein [Rheinheimera sp. KL1]KOO59969.1 hypothetical protein WH43_01200 [Rheinheimera sp. KL1]
MDIALLNLANKRLNDHILKCQLDRLIVSSIELRLCFLTESIPKKEVWLTVSGAAWVDDKSEREANFFLQRGKFLSQVYMLMGERIIDVELHKDGQLLISIGQQKLVVEPDDESFEEVWSVTPESGSQFAEFDWFVTYTDNHELLVK